MRHDHTFLVIFLLLGAAFLIGFSERIEYAVRQVRLIWHVHCNFDFSRSMFAKNLTEYEKLCLGRVPPFRPVDSVWVCAKCLAVYPILEKAECGGLILCHSTKGKDGRWLVV